MSGQSQRITGAVVFVVSVAAFVYLTVAGKDTSALITLVGPVVGGLLVSGHVSNVTDQQNQTIAKIDKQTNGVMDARIRDGVTAVLSDAGLLPATPAADSVAPQADPVTAQAPADPAASGS